MWVDWIPSSLPLTGRILITADAILSFALPSRMELALLNYLQAVILVDFWITILAQKQLLCSIEVHLCLMVRLVRMVWM
jgi:hypothetical protein